MVWWCGVMVLGILLCGTDGGLVSCGTLSCASCCLKMYFVLLSGIVYCDECVVLWWWCVGDVVELSYS